MRSSGAVADLKSQPWGLDLANNWSNTTCTMTTAGAAFQERDHDETNALVEETVGAASTTLDYDANGNLVDDGEHIYKWDFKNRLRQVNDKASGDVLGRYWYDAENRRIRKELPQELTTTVYFVDGMNEVQESDCYGKVLRQYVYGEGTDEGLEPARCPSGLQSNEPQRADVPVPLAGPEGLILMDRPRATVALVEESCGLLTGDSADGGLPDMLDCLEPTLATPPAIGVSGTCGPCAYEVAYVLQGRFVSHQGDATGPPLGNHSDGVRTPCPRSFWNAGWRVTMCLLLSKSRRTPRVLPDGEWTCRLAL